MSPLDRDDQQTVLRQLVDVLPDDCGLVLLGNTAGIRHEVAGITTTKDVDVSVILLDEAQQIAPRERIDEILNHLGVEPSVYPEDRSWVQAKLPVDGVPRKVDFIPGPQTGPAQRDVHPPRYPEYDHSGCLPNDHVLVPSLTDLILMKAWAATDQARRADDADGDEREQALRRMRAYQGDTRRYTETALDRGKLDPERLTRLLGAMRDHRRPEVRSVLERAGTIDPDHTASDG